ncbi:MAG: hypothetical protein MI724_18895, partial [Spirochaetales bacterium]|nr:hypothetical protein [Spirochaetales bacterium]
GAVTREIGAGQVVLFGFERDIRFLDGIEITVTPRRPFSSVGAFSLTVYGSVDRPDTDGIANLVGRALATAVLAGADTQTIAVPLGAAHGVGPERGRILATAADPRTGAVALHLVPAMKGMTVGAVEQVYEVEVHPILRPVGAIVVELVGDAELVSRARGLLDLTLDGESIVEGEIVERPPGIYRLDAMAGEIVRHVVNVGIEVGRIQRVTVEATEPRASIHFVVPSVAEVYWNGALLSEHRDLSVSPGVYALLVRLGDFSVSRQVTVEANREYEIEVGLDILVKED